MKGYDEEKLEELYQAVKAEGWSVVSVRDALQVARYLRVKGIDIPRAEEYVALYEPAENVPVPEAMQDLQATPQTVDVVNHPQHYETNGLECIEVMQTVYGAEALKSYCMLNAFKYLWRCEQKGAYEQDLKKARWYLSKLIELSEEVAA